MVFAGFRHSSFVATAVTGKLSADFPKMNVRLDKFRRARLKLLVRAEAEGKVGTACPRFY